VRRRSVLLVLLITGLLAASYPVAHNARQDRPSDATASHLGLKRCAQTPMIDACIAGLVDAITTSELADLVAATEQTFRTQPNPSCHVALHALGRSVSDRVLDDPDFVLGDLWMRCGAGFLHGVFETVKLAPGSTMALSHCRRAEFLTGEQFGSSTGRNDASAPNPYYSNCVHAPGHSA
jgi:hypothetical protein